ncbi:MAG: hypothetical protein AAGL49_00975 [Pseudomonadota bacterium]
MPVGLTPGQYSRFQVHRIKASDMEAAPLLELPFNPGVTLKGYKTEIDEPAAQVIVEDFLPGTEFSWTFVHDELQYALSGKIDIEVFLPPLYGESVKTTLDEGCIYLFPAGTRMHVKVLGDEPYRHICICVPNPGYPFPPAESMGGAG